MQWSFRLQHIYFIFGYLWRVLKVGKSLIVFKSFFVVENGYGMVYGFDIGVFEGVLIEVFGILNLFAKISIVGMWVAILALTLMNISGSTFHTLTIILLISGWYLLILAIIIYGKNLSLQYVNLMNWIVRSKFMCIWRTFLIWQSMYIKDVWFKSKIRMIPLISIHTMQNLKGVCFLVDCY